MRAEPRDFQYATPTGVAERAAYADADLDASQIRVLAGDRVEATGPAALRGSGGTVRDFVRFGDIGSIGRWSEFLREFRLSAATRSALVAGTLVATFGLGWVSASMFNSAPEASLPPADQIGELARGKLAAQKPAVRHHHRIVKTTVAPRTSEGKATAEPKQTELSKTKLAAAGASGGDAQSILSQGRQEGSDESNPPLVPVPETKPTTIPGWTVREVYGDSAVLAGPDHIWTVKTGDTVPGVGRVDSIVRWGSRWIVATTAGLISTE